MTETIREQALVEDLCMACRVGDIENVDKLLSMGANVNKVDKFDNTALYLASLCGHEPIVKLLLQRGAVCDTDKYEGARCVYGALTDKIRKMLISYDISKAVDTNLPFASHFRSLFLSRDLLSEDLVIQLGDNSSAIERCHRFMLSARNAYFRQKLTTTWKHANYLELNEEFPDELALRCIIDHIYLIQDSSKFGRVNKEKLLEYAKWFQLHEFASEIEEYLKISDIKERSKFMNELQVKVFEDARIDFKLLVDRGIIANKLEMPIDQKITVDQIKELQYETSTFPDIVIYIEDEYQGKTVYFPVHRSVLVRVEYFKVMFGSSFSESQYFEINQVLDIVDRATLIPVINLPVSSIEVAEIIIKYLYFDHTDIPEEFAIDVLFAGDLLLSDRLKTMAAVTITRSDQQNSYGYDLYDILRAGWQTRVDRLEHYAARLIADDIDKFLVDPRFREIVDESSKRIEKRQETDTIELIDDIRFYLAKKWKIDFDGLFEGETESADFLAKLPGFENYQTDLDKIEILLEDLQLEA
ncbi:hypothetical protein WICMUC_002161 [Wickerhamomyces mucosus]|uniref:BTB domain-containing protein n=1 Tax=Wickerhamomyces mucosus TaxID=1378264 RepID=A0A9P8PRS8_9ASCO|nr:hypothetical protein WICMUC_002161 [Wickerhamomyces mucosus]